MVTGGTGTLGRRVIEGLRERGREARVMSRSGRPGTIRGDLLTGEGVEKAVRGVSTVIHLATDPRRGRWADVGGTESLLREATAAGARHFVYVSIVGVDRNPFPYYRAKLDAERAVERSAVPWTILRATQFHEFVLGLLRLSDRMPFAVVPKGFLLQPVDAGEVAGRLVELAFSEPAGRVPDFGGPEVRTAAQLARSYRGAKGLGKGVLEVPIPGGAARAFREGAQVAPGSARGTISWEDFLRRTIPVPAQTRGAGA